LIDTLDEGGVVTFTTGGAENVVPVVVVVVVAPPPDPPPFVGPLASVVVLSLAQAVVMTDGVDVQVGHDPPL
jgi:hypothetical protein